MKPARLGRFVAHVPPAVVRDNDLDGAPALLVGWWVDQEGTPTQAVVLSMSSLRAPHRIAGWSGEAIHPPTEPQEAADVR